MARKRITKRKQITGQDVRNQTDSELQILKNIEQIYYKNNPNALKRNILKSLNWFREYVPRNYHRVKSSQMFKDATLLKEIPRVGKMYFFEYDAIHKDKLPVWDRYPLIFPFRMYRDEKNGKSYMVGLNLHYLPPKLRMVAYIALLDKRNEKRFRKQTRLAINWSILKSLASSDLFAHCVKKYRMDAVKSRFVEIPAKSWELSVFLPLASWQKGSKTEAWKMKLRK